MDIDYNVLLSNENFINQLEENYYSNNKNNNNNNINEINYYLPSITEENKSLNKIKLPSLNTNHNQNPNNNNNNISLRRNKILKPINAFND